MNVFHWIELAVFVGLLLVLTKPLGLYLYRILESPARSFSVPVVGRVEKAIYRILGVRPDEEQDWQHYTFSVLGLSAAATLFTYGVLRLQHFLPLNPEHLRAVIPHLAFSTAASFATNTDWQSYSGESAMSYFSQMVALAFQNFMSAAVGIAVAAALVRGVARRGVAQRGASGVGNLWRDIVRVHLYLLLPLAIIFACLFLSQGVIQNFRPYTKAEMTVSQRIVQGPIASQEAIKIIGTNGGGYTGANSAHPFENPTPLTNFLEVLGIFLIPAGMTYYLGLAAKNRRHGWSLWAAMALLFLVGILVCWAAETAGNPRMHALGVDPAGGNMEGKEVRFGAFGSALFATATTDASCGAVNSMHDSFTPLGGLVPLVNIELGEVIFGGVGAGLFGMLVFVILAVFLAGLMVGRTPEYLGKKIDSHDVRLCVIAVLILAFDILGFTAWAVISKWGVAGITNSGPHGLSQVLYAFSSATGNNGSAFAGFATDTPWLNTTMGAAMLVGRFLFIVPVLALAGRLAAKKQIPATTGTFPVSGPLFVALLAGTVIIVGALTFFPALSLGPILEHFMMIRSTALF